MLRPLNSLPLLYLIMLLPGRFVIQGIYDEDWYYPQMMYDSGVWSIRLLLLTFAVTPALMVINRIGYGAAVGRWLLQRRRHFGLGSFTYGVLHLLHYVIETGNLQFIWREAFQIEFAVGWIGFIIFAVLAITSNNTSVRLLGRGWKPLHRWVYPATVLIFLHWYLFDFFTQRVLFWLALFAMAKLLHVGLVQLRQYKRTA